MEEVAEGSTCYVTASFLDKAGALASPTAVRYQVHCGTSGEQLVAETSVTPGPSVEITLGPAVNTMVDEGRGAEERRVSVVAEYGGAGDAVRADYAYTLRNLRFGP